MGPGLKYAKLVNEKATEMLDEIQYCVVDNSVRVVLLEEQQGWKKIRIVEPEWLRDTHVGWVPANIIVSLKEIDRQTHVELDPKDYRVLKTDHRPVVQNFHVWLKHKPFDENYVFGFIKAFRQKHCTMQCNVSVYDTDSIADLIGVYPLNAADYLRMADHLISSSSFDATEVRDWYPYQDFHYRELGGKNWKKEPISQ